MLWAEVRIGLPARVEQDEDGSDVMARCDREEGVETLEEALGILLVELVLQEDAHGIHADGLGQAKLTVINSWIEGCGLKHLELVDGVGGDVVSADEPGLASVPGVSRVFLPAGWGARLRGQQGGETESEGKDVESHHRNDTRACGSGCR